MPPIYVIELTEGHAIWSVLILRSFILNTLWTVYLYCVMRALRLLSVADMTMLLGILSPYSYLFTWILVPKKFVAFRIANTVLFKKKKYIEETRIEFDVSIESNILMLMVAPEKQEFCR
ncbi:hypothetical protein ACTXT7_016342 [Hymenolepis weldensis]